MITDSEKRDLVYKTFLVNASERLDEIERNLSHLKDDPNSDRINHLIQLTYGVGGTAESLEFPTVSVVAHLLEENFKKLLNPRVVVDSELESLLLQGYECLKLPLQAETTPIQLDEPEILKWIITIFAQLHLKLESFGDRRQISRLEESIDEIADYCLPGTDVTQAIFETWIGQRLANLAFTLAHADTAAVAAYLREQCSVFIDLSIQLNLEGFGEIAKTAVSALDLHPEKATTIAQIALADFLSGQILILSGDRTHGGQPSEKLKQLSASKYPSARTPQLPGFVAHQGELGLRSTPKNALNAEIHVDDQRLTAVSQLVNDVFINLTQQTVANRKIQHYAQSFQKKLLHLQETVIASQPVSSASPQSLSQSMTNELRYIEYFSKQLLDLHLQAEQPLQKQHHHLEQIQQHLFQLRTLSLDALFNRLPLFIEKWAEASGKEVEVHYQNHQVRINREISGSLNHLILSLIYMSLLQGIEDPDTRHRLSKAKKGQIQIQADQQKDRIMISIGHDGQGLNFEQIREQSVLLRLQSTEQAARLSKQQLLDLLLQAKSYSHRWNYARIGLGVGFKYLQARLGELKGSLTIHSTSHDGTSFVITLPNQQQAICEIESSHHTTSSSHQPTQFEDTAVPLTSKFTPLNSPDRSAVEVEKNFPNTLKTNNFFIWLSNSVVFALPYDNILGCVIPRLDQLFQSKQQQFLPWQGQMVPFYNLSELLNSTCRLPETLSQDKSDTALTLVVQQGLKRFAITSMIKHLIIKSEMRINPLSDAVKLPRSVRGCTILDDSHIAFVVDVADLMRQTLDIHH
ncbi:chemotaxis protein CheW [Acaryochloris thomasi]|nr:chemotaxis protein CheW [Acaryochloris thomasi]